MTLREWMKATKTEPAALAARLGVHWVTVYKWARGSARPGFTKLVEIERITNGQVTARTIAHEANAAGVTGSNAPVSAPPPQRPAEAA